MFHTHTPAEWAALLSLGISCHAAMSVPYFVLVDADLADFDPRPFARRVLESGRLDPVLIAVADAKYAARMRLSAPVSAPKGATHA